MRNHECEMRRMRLTMSIRAGMQNEKVENVSDLEGKINVSILIIALLYRLSNLF